MKLPQKWQRPLVYLLVFFSGCAGLVYEVVWQRYLSILLGAQARATAIVLAIFLGGISLGYATFGRWSRRKKWNLLFAYALVELGLGFWAFSFPYLFKVALPVVSWAYHHLGTNNIWSDIVISVALIGFPTFLMGGTLPLLTQAMSNTLAEASQVHARIYGFNTVGASLGALLAGYVLIPLTNFAITTTLAGLVNVVIAFVSYFYFAKNAKRSEGSTEKAGPRLKMERPGIYVIGVLSGFYVLTLQTVIGRLMALASGSSQYHFSLVVAIFVLGLGASALVVRRINTYRETHLFWNQIAIAFSLMLLYFTCDSWSYLVHFTRAIFRETEFNFYLFHMAVGALFAAIWIVPIGLCGLTLPLCFHLIKDRKDVLGYRVGQLYSLNTLGCVSGALLGGYFLLNFFNLDQIFKLCIFLSLAAAAPAYFIAYPKTKSPRAVWVTASVIAVVTIISTINAPLFAKNRFLQPFRYQELTEATFAGPEAFGRFLGDSIQHVYYKDGPNSTVAVVAKTYMGLEQSRSVLMNGKSDGSTWGDFFTMAMTGHIPALLGKSIERVGVVGLGTGVTVGSLALYPEVKSVDVAEISGTLVDNIKLFDKYNGDVSKNSKIHFHEMDAFRFFGGTGQKFDLVVSEPSNPWVSGIENLFTTEFYDIIDRKLTDDGVFVQWIHAYSFSDDLFRMVLKTLTSRFPNVSVFQLQTTDYALVASKQPFSRGDLQNGARRLASSEKARQSLSSAGILDFETMLAYEVIPNRATAALAEGAEEHSLYSPKLSTSAGKAFFMRKGADVVGMRRKFHQFFGAVPTSLIASYLGDKISWDVIQKWKIALCDHPISLNATLCSEVAVLAQAQKPALELLGIEEKIITARELAAIPAFYSAPKRDKFSSLDLDRVDRMFEVISRHYSPVARLPIEPVINQLDHCLATVSKSVELYGDCFTKKLTVLQLFRYDEYRRSAPSYLSWFAGMTPNAAGYLKFERFANAVSHEFLN